MSATTAEAYTIRHGIPADGAGIAGLLTALGHATSAEDVAQRWAPWAAQSGNIALVAVSTSGELLALATLHQMNVLHRARPVGRVTALVVDAALRGQGIGKALLLQAEALLTASGCGLLEITSNDRLLEAHAFYQHLGYQRSSLRLVKTLNAA